MRRVRDLLLRRLVELNVLPVSALVFLRLHGGLGAETRYRAYTLGLAAGRFSINEVRAAENLPPITDEAVNDG